MNKILRYSYSKELGLYPDRDGSLSYYGSHLADKKAALAAQAEEHVTELAENSRLYCQEVANLKLQHKAALEAQAEEHAGDRLVELAELTHKHSNELAESFRKGYATKEAEARGEGEPKIETSTFRKELTHLINFHSQENGSNTPDFILAQFLDVCLGLWNQTVRKRDTWYGENHDG